MAKRKVNVSFVFVMTDDIDVMTEDKMVQNVHSTTIIILRSKFINVNHISKI